MRHQHKTCVMRLGLVAALFALTACAENRQPEPASGLLTDYASGVDAAFAVETFHATDPSLTIKSPTEAQVFVYKGAAQKYPVEMVFTVANHVLGATEGKIQCFFDGNVAFSTFKETDAATNVVVDLKTPGMHTITCHLLNKTGQPVVNTQQVVHVQLSQPCDSSAGACDDGNACSIAFCVGNYCQYEQLKNCCNHKFDCSQGETCNNPGTSSKCTTCQIDKDCDDGSTCTTDTCDLSGVKGLCKNIKADPESCCSSGAAGVLECDDGQQCTNDSCDIANKKCKHEKAPGVCCSDAECTTKDTCSLGTCVNFECRFNANKFRPDCCSDATNPTCNDDYSCTIDKCATEMESGAWKQCTHTKDPAKPNCCGKFKQTEECQDGNACTGDYCDPVKEECVHVPLPDCCANDKDCNDSNFCTNDTCKKENKDDLAGKCEHVKPDPLCCISLVDCDDGNWCTYDTCDLATNKCSFPKSNPKCCDANSECDDGKTCTEGVCVNHGCSFIQNKFKPNCCDASSDCNDGKPCTIDSCDTVNNLCKFVDNGDTTCCNGPEDCDDKKCETVNFCTVNNKCSFKADYTKCAVNLDCDDNNPCTDNICDTSGACGECKYKATAGCCVLDSGCDDGKLCTLDKCVNNKCEHTAIKECCVDDKDAITSCDDKNSCTIDYCLNNSCRHTLPKNGCCVTKADCDDGNTCSTDTCTNVVDGKGSCSHTLVAGCKCVDETSCNDQNPCTTDACIGGLCTNKAIAGCCEDKFDCDDGAPCTTDYCVFNYCIHPEVGGTESLCCSVATQDSDCAYLNTECAKGICETQADKSRKCASKAVDICTVQIGYCQDFSTGTSLNAMGWNPGDVAGGAKGNWKPSKTGLLGPDQYAEFTWTPTFTDYDSCLQSPVIQAAGSKKITIQYDRLIDINKSGATSFRLLGSLDGAAVDWTKATLIDIVTPTKDDGPATLDLTLPPELTGSNGLRLAFCASGKTTFDVTRIGVDNVCVVKGSKPKIAACPPNQLLLLGAVKTIPVKAKDLDTDAILSFSLVKAPKFVTLSSALYYWLDASWNASLTIKPVTLDDVGTHDVTIKVSDGLLYSLCTFKITVTYNGGYLVWRPSEVPVAAGNALYDAVGLHTTAVVQHTDDLSLYTDLSKFAGIFVTLGVFPDNHVLNATEAGRLKLFLQLGGKLYLESGDTWSFDSKTDLHPLFHVKAIADNSKYGVTDLKGLHIYKDIKQSPTKVYNWSYSQAFTWNNLNDVIGADTDVVGTRAVLQSKGASETFWAQVAHDNAAAGYRTVASSVLFGGVTKDLNDAPDTMIARVIHFFLNGYVDCNNDAHCDDSNSCTTDKCSLQLCQNINTCTCKAANSSPLACAGSQQLVSNAAASTAIVDAYSCDPGVKYDGKEIAYTFTSATSKPTTLTISNLTNTKGKVFVLRANADGSCAPLSCIASGGNGKIEFAAAKGVTYHIVLDVQAGGTAQADMAIGCGAAEICDDGKDNNGNALIDCKDIKSCCGDAACGEICDGVDNDCDGQTDEGCDDDGDDYCDSGIAIVGTPPTCSKGGGDCNDDNSSVNPGAKEICFSGKDDNCSGGKDEQGAVGCTNFFTDLDKDGFGAGAAKCLCAASGAYSTKKGGDCDDANVKVKPEGQAEICGNGLDDDCSGSQNDLNAVGCKDFFNDDDGDGYGTLPKKCLCYAEGSAKTDKGGDCDDADKGNSPGLPEICDDKDNDCDSLVDEGCDDDKDGYCDNDLKYVSIGGNTVVCSTAAEGASVVLTCNPGSSITDITFASYGTPTGTCNNYAIGACNAASSVQKLKDGCLGKTTCVLGANNTTFGDPCGGVGKKLYVQVVCTSASGTTPKICPKGPGDTNDNDPNVNPKGDEVCDGIDNNSNGTIDEKCDKDGDKYCDKDAVVVGAPPVCPKGGKDCDDTNAGMNPGNQEDCATPWDDNCDGDTNDLNAKNCTPLFFDNDADGYGTSDFKCLCKAIGKYVGTKTNDCNDSDPDKHPGAIEICDNVDNDCDGVVDEGCDDDNDGYCDAAMKLGALGATICPNGTGDCNDTNANVNPGKAEICGDGLDNDCDGSENDAGAVGCKMFYADTDGDGYGTTTAKCLCVAEGTFSSTSKTDCNDSSADIKPGAVELCDGKDNNCDGQTDEGCDDDKDGYCDDKMVVVGTPTICSKGKGDCDDTDAKSNPGIAQEVCDNKDNDCDGEVDDGCDKDNDGYCDSGYSVANPAPKVCLKGGGDCNDYNNDQNPAATEVCGNKIDDDCDGSQNNENATNCTDFYFDQDNDGYGLNVKKCFCVAEGYFRAPKGADCADTDVDVNPGKTEICANGKDDDCDGSQNDPDATNCKVFYLDQDNDGYGLANVKQCLCVAADSYTATKVGDCNDLQAAVNPGKPEVCDDIDNDCDSKVDTGCNDDGDEYCDANMTTIGFPNVCVKGGKDCDDNKAQINPGHPEWCDDLDNNCNGSSDEGCDDDGDDYCDAGLTTVGTPTTCTKGGKDCKDDDKLVNPGMKEDCATTKDDDCSGSTNDENATGCKSFGVDADGDTFTDKNGATKCLCIAEGTLTGTKGGDCNDSNKLINPAVIELCDGVDNNCDGAVDEGCDTDKDGYCDGSMTTIGTPSICPKGGGDCNDSNAGINPGATEICGNTVDENCDNDLNGINATGCTKFYHDGDGDGWAVSLAQCLCTPSGAYKITDTKKLGDCDDTKATTNPAAKEVCGDGIDNNCNGTQNDPGATNCKNFYKDNDKDGYGGSSAACLCVAEGVYVTPLAGDCNESDSTVNPGKTEICDGKDNNCKGGSDEGCDDDGDKWCDANMVTIGQPGVCPNGGGDCDDSKSTVHPGVTEICDNIDQDCDGTADNECDADNDGYCDKNKTVVGTPAVCNKGLNDCDDANALVNPGKSEICDDADNNCDGVIDEKCDIDGDGYCTNAKSVIGTPKVCVKGVGDCNDNNDKIYPGAPEECNGIDDNCAGGADETCVDGDGDGYCTGNVSASKGCPNGGNDCNDTDSTVHPGAQEDCSTTFDDNCNGLLNEKNALNCVTFFEDTDGDGYGNGTGGCFCQQQNKFTATRGGDCDETDAKIHPGATETCDGKNNDCDYKSFVGAQYKGAPITMNTYSYGGMYHLFRKEYWYPSWSGATVYRYGDDYVQKGSHSTGQGSHMGIAGDPLEDTYYTGRYTGSSTYDRVRKHQGITSTLIWTAPYQTTYMTGVTADANGVYAMNYNGSTVYVFNRGTGSKLKQFNLSYWSGGYTYGSFFAAGGKLFRANYSDRTFYRYDITTGVYDGFSFQVAPTVYTTAYNGKDVCVSDGSSNVYCYNVPTDGSFMQRVIGVDPKGQGGGFHLKHKEYWYPEWSGGTVHRYGVDNSYLGTFANGLSSVQQIWGPADEDDYYAVRHTSSSTTSRVYKLKNKSATQVWNQYVTTYMSGVAADDKAVYAMRYNSSTVYQLNKATGALLKTFALSGDYDSQYTYGGLAVIGTKLFRATYSNRNVYRYDLATGKHDGMKFRVTPYVYGSAYNGTELCYSSTSGLPFCYKAPSSATTYDPAVVGVDPKSYGGGYHLQRKEWWYPEYTGGNTSIYRYGSDHKEIGSFQTGQAYIRGLTSDTDEDNYYIAQYSTTSSIARVRKMKGMSSSVVWTGNTQINYLTGVAVNGDYVYAGPYNSNYIYVFNRSNGVRVSSKEFNCSGTSTSTNYGGIAIHNNLLYRTSAAVDVSTHSLTNGAFAGLRFKVATQPYGVAYTGTQLCINSTGLELPYCYDLDAYGTTKSTVYTSMNTNYFGGGYHPFRKEWWYPQWSSTTIYRYDTAKKYIGAHNSGMSSMTQVAGDPGEDTYYLARWYGSSSSYYSYVTKYKGITNSEVWTTRSKSTLNYYLSGVGVHKDNVYVMNYSSNYVYALSRTTGARDSSKDFTFKNYPALPTSYGGFMITGDTLWRTGYDQSVYQFEIGSGNYTGASLTSGISYPYSSATDGKEMCFGTSSSSSPATCITLPTDTTKLIPARLGPVTHSYGGGFHPYYNEYWYPQNGTSIVHRYDLSFKNTGSFDIGFTSVYQLSAEKAGNEVYAARYSSSSKYSRIYKVVGGTSTLKWTSPYFTTYVSGVAVGDSHVYAGRYNSATIYRLDKTNGALVSTFNLSGDFSGSAMYGGLSVQGSKLYRATTDRWVYGYDLATGVSDGVMWQIPVAPYSSANNGTEICYGSSATAAPIYCHKIPAAHVDFTGRPLGMDVKSNGGGFHAFHNEYWFPEWAGGWVWRYGINQTPLGKFDSKLSSTWQLWGDKSADYYYTAQYTSSSSSSLIRKMKGKTSTVTWTAPPLSSYMTSVAADENYVYAMSYSGTTVWKLSKTNGQTAETFALTGSFSGNNLYGGLAVENGKLWRVDSSGNTYRYDLTTHAFDGVSYTMALSPRALAFNGTELCASTGAVGQVYCYAIYDVNNPSVDEGCDDDGDGYCDTDMIVTDAGAKATCPKSQQTCDGSEVGGNCYKAVNSGTTWTQAEAACDAWGGHLASAANKAEATLLGQTAQSACGNISYWLGYTDAASEGVFRWTDGTPQVYKNWKTGEPTSKTILGSFTGGSLLTTSQMSQLNNWYGKANQGWKLCYSKSKHGASATTFHNQCNGKGASITVIKANNGYVFGGFNAKSWYNGSYDNHNTSWLYSLTRNTKHKNYRYPEYGTYNGSSYGPTWGGGHDLHVPSAMVSGSTGLGHGYECPTGYGYGSSQCYGWLHGGSGSSFTAVDVEVYVLDAVGVSNGQDYVYSDYLGAWYDAPNATKLSCYVCKRPLTAAQYGKGDDCADTDAAQNPTSPELCDGKDNNCNGVVDEGCDDDGDGYCDQNMVTIGGPAVCVKGGGDCDDYNKNINPAAAESCATPYDDNCDGVLTAINAAGCVNLFYDDDGDGFGTSSFQCQCPGVTCGSSPYSENFEKKLVGWSLKTCAAGTQTTPTSCVDYTGTQGWQHSLDATYAAGGQGALYYGDKKLNSFDFGATAGTATSSKFKVPPSGKTSLKFSAYLGVNAATTEDTFAVRVYEAGKYLKTIWSKKDGAGATFKDSKILNVGDMNKINGFYGNPNQNWTLCYQKSVNGNSSSTFHSLCNGKGATMTVVKATNGYIFGGYNNNSWSTAGYVGTSTAWLYSVTRNTKHSYYRYPQYGTYNSSSYGPTWGGGHDMYHQSSMTSGSSNLGYTYRCQSGASYGNSSCRSWLAGTNSWSVAELEVYVLGASASSAVANQWHHVDVDMKEFAGKEIQVEFYFNTVNNLNNKGLGLVIDNFSITDESCTKYSAAKSGDCDDTNASKYPSQGAEVCDGVDNNCNGTIDEECDSDKDGYCDKSKPLFSTYACPKTGLVATANCTVTTPTTPTWDGARLNVNHSVSNYGATYHEFRKEYWFSNWSSSTTIYRYGTDFKYLGGFGTGTYYSMDLAGDNKTDHYYSGSHHQYRVYKKSGVSSSQVWQSGSVGYDTGGVASDTNYVYGMAYNSKTVYVFNKSNGSTARTFSMTGTWGGTLYGGLVVHNDVLYRGGTDRWVRGYKISNGAYTGVQFQASMANYQSFIRDNKKYCTSATSSYIDCYDLVKSECTTGDDCNDKQSNVNPQAVETCDDFDNNCDGTVDEKCDVDGDGYCAIDKGVVGAPKVCTKGGGDCDDANKTKNPGSSEICDGKDNNCDGVIDPENSAGCTKWYYDGDVDGYGVQNSSKCLCKKTGLYSTQTYGDCDDNCQDCKPMGTETCDDKDNNCNGAVDEGCDADGDDWCTDKMLTIGKPKICPKGGGDCQDGYKSRNPGVAELCNNIDDNCNGIIDENASSFCTEPAKNATAKCIAGKCINQGCSTGFYDLNNTMADGCECNGKDTFEPNDTCETAVQIGGTMSDKTGGSYELFAGMMVEKADIDWFKVYAQDLTDSGTSACDNFRVRFRFIKNPSNRYRFSVWRGGCPTAASSPDYWKASHGVHGNPTSLKKYDNNVCCGQEDFNWFTRFKAYTRNTYSSYDSEYGECNCTTSYSGWSTRPGYNYGPGNGKAGPYGMWKSQMNPGPAGDIYMPYNSLGYGYAKTWCNDDSAWFYIKVYKAQGSNHCGGYVMEFSNGVYSGSTGQLGFNQANQNKASPTPN